jgi:hypothetical protein
MMQHKNWIALNVYRNTESGQSASVAYHYSDTGQCCPRSSLCMMLYLSAPGMPMPPRDSSAKAYMQMLEVNNHRSEF